MPWMGQAQSQEASLPCLRPAFLLFFHVTNASAKDTYKQNTHNIHQRVFPQSLFFPLAAATSPLTLIPSHNRYSNRSPSFYSIISIIIIKSPPPLPSTNYTHTHTHTFTTHRETNCTKMDDHFERMLESMGASSSSSASTTHLPSYQLKDKGAAQLFQPSKHFQGPRPGMVFKRGPRGMGYYEDVLEMGKLRAEGGDGGGGGGKRRRVDEDGAAVLGGGREEKRKRRRKKMKKPSSAVPLKATRLTSRPSRRSWKRPTSNKMWWSWTCRGSRSCFWG